MRRLVAAAAGLLAGVVSASAADLPTAPAAPAYAPPPFSWTGFYLGGNLGGAWVQNDWTDTVYSLDFNSSNFKFIGGGQIGFNYQTGSVVWGVEGEFDWMGNGGNGVNVVVPPSVPVLGGNTLQVISNNNWVSTLAGRVGLPFDRALIYAKVGGGWIATNGFAINNLTTGSSITGVNSNTQGVWLWGAGVEWAFAYNWTVKFEYDYLGLSDRTVIMPQTSFLAGNSLSNNGTSGNNSVQMVKLGINYLFSWGAPVTARY